MSGLLAIIVGALIIWRLYNIAKVVFTEDFFKGCCILGFYLLAVFFLADHSTIMGKLIMAVGGFLAVIFRKQARIQISSGWIVASFFFMALFILIINFLFGFRGNEIVLVLIGGILLMTISSQFRLPWFVGIQLCLLGLVVANVSDNGGLDGVDTMDMSAAEASAPIGSDYSVGTGSYSGWGTDVAGMGESVGDVGASTYSSDTWSSPAYEPSAETTIQSDSASYASADTAWYQVSAPSMSPQGSFAMDSSGEGIIYDDLNTQVGTISHDEMNNMVMKDNWGNVIGTADGNGFVYDAAGTPIAHVEQSGGVNTVRVLNGDEVILDNNGFMTDKNGCVVGSISQK